MGGGGSPLDAMNAYMHALQLCKDRDYTKTVEPKCMEFISALAAGSRARLLVDVSPGGMSPATLALAVAARHTGGSLVCMRHEPEAAQGAITQLERLGLGDVVQFEIGSTPCQAIKRYKNIDFAVVDRKVEDCIKLLSAMDMNPSGSVVVVSNACCEGRAGRSHGQLVKGKGRFGSVILPIGGGMEVIRIGGGNKKFPINGRCKVSPVGTKHLRRSNRTFVVYEEHINLVNDSRVD